ncbi:MAG: hypothetical protein A2901_08270 [Elusimicrobia bacterium RIFCSPLOWO2_01_FULL_54_10]|nr:MAG: hypothetical protein A2901_08270 [Elusimicrobia bacterium RIFCSPLOWO2_01_FULL_54_10]
MPRKKRVLVVDDDIGILALLRAILKKDFEVTEARTADSALEMLEHEAVDLVISDMKMPGMSGLEFLHEVREWDMELPVIFVSGRDGGKSKDTAAGTDASAFIQKPFKKETLLKTVRQVLSNGHSAAPSANGLGDIENLEY